MLVKKYLKVYNGSRLIFVCIDLKHDATSVTAVKLSGSSSIGGDSGAVSFSCKTRIFAYTNL